MAGKKKGESDGGFKIVAENRKARHDYELLDKFEAGIVLTGPEVKAVRAGEINLRDTYIRPKGSELFLVGCHIAPYTFARLEETPAIRDRKLLLHKKEIEKLIVQMTQKGLTLLALKAYFKGGKCKIEIAVGKGKKHYDKRQDIKARDAEREMARVRKR